MLTTPKIPPEVASIVAVFSFPDGFTYKWLERLTAMKSVLGHNYNRVSELKTEVFLAESKTCVKPPLKHLYCIQEIATQTC